MRGGRSTFDKKEWHRLRKLGFEENIIEVPVLKLDTVIENNRNSIQDIYFIKIDCEGLERDVLKGLTLTKYRPYIITLEATLPGTNVSCAYKYEDLLLNENYILSFDDGVNRYYVRKENIDLKDCFLSIKTYYSIYEIYKPVEFTGL